MTSMFAARRRAEEFAAMIDGGSAAAGDRDADLADFVAIVATLRHHHDVAPRSDFTRDLRQHLMAEAQTALAPQKATLLLPVRPRGARERRLVAAASALVLIGGTTTMATAAQSALPGEALYPIKRGIERAEAGLSMSEAGKGQDLLTQAESRLTEVEGLLESDSVESGPRVPVTLADFSAQADEGAVLLLDSFEQTQNPDSVLAVRSFATEAIKALEKIAAVVPPDAQDELTVAAMTLRDIDERAKALCGTCLSDVPTVEVPDALLARAEVNRALQSVTGRELDNSHPVVVPKGATGKSGASASPRPKDTPGGSEPTDPAAGPTQAPPKVPAKPALPNALPTPSLPGAGGQAAGGGLGGNNPPPEVTKPGKKLTSGLGGAETLLPDPDGVNLP